MPDKFEREIEEILAKLDDGDKAAAGNPGRPPISISEKRQQKAKAKRVRTSGSNPMARLSPTSAMFTGVALVVGGFIVSGAWGPAIWIALAGVVVFIGAFLWSFRKTERISGPGPSKSQGTFWRDRYINDKPDGGIKDRFRRK